MLTINDVIEVLSDAQAAEMIDAGTFVSLLTLFNRAIAAKPAAPQTRVRPDPSESRPSASEKPRRVSDDDDTIKITPGHIAYPDSVEQEPPMGTVAKQAPINYTPNPLPVEE